MSDITAEVFEQTRSGDDSYLEFKEVRLGGKRLRSPRPDAIADELAAFERPWRRLRIRR